MPWLDLKIGARVALAFGVVVLTIVLLVLAVQVGLFRSAANSQAMGNGVALQSQASEVHLLAKDNAIASMVILVSSSADLQAKLTQEIAQRDARILRGLDALEKELSGSEDDAALLQEVRKRHKNYVGGVQRIVGMVKDGKQAEAAFAADEEMIPMLAPFMASLDKLNARQVSNVQAKGLANSSLIASTRSVAGIAGVLVAVFAAAAGLWLVRSITGPLRQAVALAEAVAQGDLTQRVATHGRDEIATLMRALDGMQSNLSSVVRKVRLGSDSVASASAEIASGNMDLSNRTEQQAAALARTDAAMAELGNAVKYTANSAGQANQLALQASSVAARGGRGSGPGGANHAGHQPVLAQDFRHHPGH